mmetsp:Transcript_3013/g.7551  ORF Transcript_3013/g.7551 Transcript_3013/m.7551 type:complete len:231 (+) Transcript_3013:261-953(+)
MWSVLSVYTTVASTTSVTIRSLTNCFPSSESRMSLYFSKASPSLVCSLAFSIRVVMVCRATLAAMTEKNPLPFLLKTFSSVAPSIEDPLPLPFFLPCLSRPLVDGRCEPSARSLSLQSSASELLAEPDDDDDPAEQVAGALPWPAPLVAAAVVLRTPLMVASRCVCTASWVSEQLASFMACRMDCGTTSLSEERNSRVSLASVPRVAAVSCADSTMFFTAFAVFENQPRR